MQVKAWKLAGIAQSRVKWGRLTLAQCVFADSFEVAFGFPSAGPKRLINLYGCAIRAGRITAR